jgi:hypothetical protein
MFMVVSFPWPVPSANVPLAVARPRALRPRSTSAEHSPLPEQLNVLDRTLAASKR